MRRKLGKSELLALLAAAGVSTCAAQAAKLDDSKEPQRLTVIEQPAHTNLGSGKDSACGKGSCGTDESGAKEAAKKHAAHAKKVIKSTKAAAKKKIEKKASTK